MLISFYKRCGKRFVKMEKPRSKNPVFIHKNPQFTLLAPSRTCC